MNFIVNDFNIYYEQYGTGNDSIIILPGWGDTRSTFYQIIEVLKCFYTIYIVDYPGFGKSGFPNRDLDIYDYANLIKDFIKIKSIDNPIIIGHSFGGRLGIILAGLYKLDIKKMILIDAAGIKRKKKMKLKVKQLVYKSLKKLARILPKKIRQIYLNKLINVFGSNDFKNLDQNIRKTFIKVINEDLSKYLSEINTSTLLIWGEDDIDTPVEDGKVMNIKIKDSGLIIIPNAGHFPYLQYPYYINKIILEFLKVSI
ncbi:MAG: alpha/beta hydrolase [Bacilli bacterium]|nr:alpha/beta hydrolase [Bacilli bacterium]